MRLIVQKLTLMKFTYPKVKTGRFHVRPITFQNKRMNLFIEGPLDFILLTPNIQ